jgi:hypothetical protein
MLLLAFPLVPTLTSNTFTWPAPFADANYSATRTGSGPSDLRANVTVGGRSANNVIVSVVTHGSVAVSFAELNCTGVHTHKVVLPRLLSP